MLKMWELIIGAVLWGSVGGFDWVSDMIECMTYVPTEIDPLSKKITMTVEEYLNTVISFKQTKAGPDIIITADFSIGTKEVVKETVAIPGIQNIAIEKLQENMSSSWTVTKSKAGVIRLN